MDGFNFLFKESYEMCLKTMYFNYLFFICMNNKNFKTFFNLLQLKTHPRNTS